MIDLGLGLFYLFGAICFYFGLVSLLYYPLALSYPIWERRRLKRAQKENFTPRVSVLIAAYNEQNTIALSLRSILDSDYDNFEVVVVNDGSTDNTEQEVQSFLADERVRYFKKPNGGKASALNRGLQEAQGEIVLFTDADSIFKADTIRNGVAYFVDPKVDAVSGNDTPLHPKGLMQKMLVVTSHIGTGFVRRALSMANVLPIISGNLGLVRAERLRAIGGFQEIWGEDLELTFRLHRHGARVVYGGATCVLAECPNTMSGLWKQRIRWLRSYIKVLRMHKAMLGHPRYGLFGPFLLFNAFNMILIPTLQSIGVLLLPLAIVYGDFRLYGWEWIAYLGWGFLFLASFTAILLDKSPRDLRYLPYATLLIFFSHFYNAVVLYSIWSEFRGSKESWNKLERRSLEQMHAHHPVNWLPIGAVALVVLGIAVGFWMGSLQQDEQPAQTLVEHQPLVEQHGDTAVAIHFDAWRDWRDAYRDFLAKPESRYINHVGVSAGRIDWTYFKWPDQQQWWSAEQGRTEVDMLEEAVTALKQRGYQTTAILDTHATRYIERHPDAAAQDEKGKADAEIVCSTELAQGDFGKQLLAVTESLAKNSSVDRVAVTELFYDHHCFDDRCFMDFTKSTGETDWPRRPNGRINQFDSKLMHWRSQQIAGVMQQLGTVVHKHGKQLDLDVRVSRDDLTRNSAENGQDYQLLAPHIDRFVVWEYFALRNLPPESSGRVAAYFDDEYGPGRSILSIGLWSKDEFSLGFWRRPPAFIDADQLRRSLYAARLGGANDVWITPAKELTAEHWQVIKEWVQSKASRNASVYQDFVVIPPSYERAKYAIR